MTPYQAIIENKKWDSRPVGFSPTFVPPRLFPYQQACVNWAVRKGRAALFEDCGLGKTIQQLAWAENVRAHTNGRILILAPLAVADQTAAEALRIGLTVAHVKEADEVSPGGIYITNYDRAERFLSMKWDGIVLDESSILKSSTGRTRDMLIEASQNIPYRLACTATPSPNDHTELGNHAEFLGVMRRVEMLASFFVHDGGETSVWRLKGHAQKDFWAWVAGWAIAMRKPSDIGYSDAGFAMPKLEIKTTGMASNVIPEGYAFAVPALTLSDQRSARRKTMADRVQAVANLVNSEPDKQWLIWCEMNDEGDRLANAIKDAVQVAGSTDEHDKSDYMLGFSGGKYRILISKPKIAGFGMNFQSCHRMAFVGLSHSYEQFYQAVRRCWRYGQKHDVICHIISTDVESETLRSITEKQAKADEMATAMIEAMKETMQTNIHSQTERQQDTYRTEMREGKSWKAYLGDCVEGIRKNVADESVHFSVFSPPFASLYTYSNSPYDMGNVKNDDEFFAQFKHLIHELHRVLLPGRLISFHCMNLPTSKERDGFIGVRDFRGALIAAFEAEGFIFHSEVCIWKDPVTAMQRTKALGLLHKTIRKDSSMSRQGIPDYLVTMRKRGANPEPISHGSDLPVDLWQRYASPVWMDIKPNDTLQKESAREENDERHICPLQLGVIERAIHLWSNPGDLVLSPFMGIASEGYQAIKMKRRFVGFELKHSYWKQAVANLGACESSELAQHDLFGGQA